MIKYEGYIDRQAREIERSRNHAQTPIPADFDFNAVHAISHESRQILSRARPGSIGEASRISGITPATISLLLVSLKRHRAPGRPAREALPDIGNE